jgi:uncharacterized protein YceK
MLLIAVLTATVVLSWSGCASVRGKQGALRSTAEAQQTVRDSMVQRTTVRTEQRVTQADTVVLRIAEGSLDLLPQGAIYRARGNQTELRVGRDTTGTIVVTAETAEHVDRTAETVEALTQMIAKSDSTSSRELRPPEGRREKSSFRWADVLAVALLGALAALLWRMLKRS